jgi:predicted DNA-binding transcriptional regulator AlpA
VTRPAAPLPALAERLHQLADQAERLDPAELVGQLEALKFQVWTTATNHAPAPEPTGSSRGLDITAVVARTGMSREWLYRQARAGQLPFARHHGRRVVFDEAGLTRWLARRR